MADVAVHFTQGTLPDDHMMMTIWVPYALSVQEVL